MSLPERATPRVGVIGMGLAGPGIASALRAGGHEISAVSARSETSRERAEAVLPGVPILSPKEVSELCDVLVLAVADADIENLADSLVQGGAIRPGQIVIHLAGALGVAPLHSVASVGAMPIALHPAMTFTGTSLDVRRLQGTPMAYTSSPVLRPIAESLIATIGGIPFEVQEEDRPLYHAALAHGANHLVTVIVQASEALRLAGVDDPSAVLTPLVQASLERALSEGIEGLTGPVRRGDTQTISSHLEAISSRAELQNVATTYRELTRATASLLNAEIAAQDIRVVRMREELLAELKSDSGTIGLVMTMGALHEGHISLVKEMRKRADRVVVTIFVNPTQFGEGEDFDKYPRTLDHDIELLWDAGADIVYAPPADQVYPNDPAVTVQPGNAGHILEGYIRPGHFQGVLQVVQKMFNLIRPQFAAFGQKDAQQFVNISQMVRDLDQRIELVEAPIVREADGLALSSRNRYLSDEERTRALALSHSLEVGRELAEGGASPDAIVKAAAQSLESGGVEAQYVALANTDSFEVLAIWTPDDSALGVSLTSPVVSAATTAYLLVAAKVGQTRLIDNMKVQVAASE